MGLKIAIVEDSQENIETLQYFIDRCDTPIELLGTAKTLAEAEVLLTSQPVDLALLDIQLKENNIFELLDKFNRERSISFDIIFVTAHSSFEYATKAIQYACLNYITKPVSEKELHEALQKAYERKGQGDNSAQLNLLLEIIQGNIKSPKSISINMPKGVIEIVDLEEIKYIEADGSTSYLHLPTDKRLHSVKSLAHYSSLLELNNEFMMISRQCLVNLPHVKRYDHREKVLTLKSGETLIVSHRYSKQLKQKLMSDPQNAGMLRSALDTLKNIFK